MFVINTIISAGMDTFGKNCEASNRYLLSAKIESNV